MGNMEGRLGTWGCPQDQHRLYLLSQGLLTVPPATSNLARDSSQGEPTWALTSSKLEHYQLPAMDQQQVSRLLRASVSSPVKRGECYYLPQGVELCAGGETVYLKHMPLVLGLWKTLNKLLLSLPSSQPPGAS